MSRPIRHIAVVSVDAPGGLGASVCRGFEALGVRATLAPYPNWIPTWRGRRFRGAGQLNRALGLAGRPAAEARLLYTLARMRPDLVLIIKCDDLHASVYPLLRRAAGAPLVAFHPDDPFNQGTLVRPGPANRRAVDQLRAVDLYLVWSHALVDKCRAHGARRVGYLPFACDPQLHPRVDALSDAQRAELGADLVFIGNWDKERERWLGPVAAAPDIDLAIWGNEYWSSRCRDDNVRRAWRGRPLVGDEQGAVVRAAKLNLNILRLQNKDATNMRTFEVPVMGGCMLHERSAELGEFFAVGEACEDFGDPEELVAKVRALKGADARREAMAEAAYQRAQSHTYAHRAEQILTLAREL